MSLRRSGDSRPRTLRRWRCVRFWRPDNFSVKNLCTDSTLSIRYLWWGYQAWEENSSKGLTYVQKASFIHSGHVNENTSKSILSAQKPCECEQRKRYVRHISNDCRGKYPGHVYDEWKVTQTGHWYKLSSQHGQQHSAGDWQYEMQNI